MGSPPVKAILDGQSPEGHWGDPQNMYLPKYTATTHSLLILAELGARRTTAIERGIEHMFLYQRNSGHFFVDLPVSEKGRAKADSIIMSFWANDTLFSQPLPPSPSTSSSRPLRKP